MGAHKVVALVEDCSDRRLKARRRGQGCLLPEALEQELEDCSRALRVCMVT